MRHIAHLAVSLCVALTLMLGPVQAVQPDELLDDTVLEERARDISGGLRCVVCRNESIDESNADLARDLRLLVRERLVLQKLDAIAAVLPEAAPPGTDIAPIAALLDAERAVAARAPMPWEDLAATLDLPQAVVVTLSEAADAHLAARAANDEVVSFIVDRYGEYVLLRPTLSGANIALWAAGPILLLLGLGLAFGYLRRRSSASTPTETALDAEEEARLREIMGD